MTEYDKVSADIRQRSDLLNKLRVEQNKVEIERDKSEKANTNLINQIDQYTVPDVIIN
jgi:hypothetical protein